MATETSTDYLRWNANSIKDVIVNKLNEDGVYSDQLFEGSNLSTIVDVFAYMYDTLTFYLNHGATEAIFTDAQLYENINRIVKMLGYNPQGFITSSVISNITKNEGAPVSEFRTVMPKYATVTTTSTDGEGEPIEYTFTEHYPFVVNQTGVASNFTPTIYNGTWKSYPTTFTSVGIPFETFTLDQIDLDGDDKIYVADAFIDCIVQLEDGTFEYYTPVRNLYNSTSTDKHFEVRINENKQYTLKFGDNINGDQLPENVTLYVVYLQSNGPDGEIGGNGITTDDVVNVKIDGLSESFIKNNILRVDENIDFITFGDPNIGYTGQTETMLQYIGLSNNEASTPVQAMEGVDDIKQNAPDWFRMGSRLITEQDFRQYVLSVYGNLVYDVTVMNGWKYMVEVQEWLRIYEKLNIEVRNYDYYFSDSCDFNNIYLWLKGRKRENVTTDAKKIIVRDCDRLKPVTSEIIPLDPFIMTCTPYIQGDYSYIDWDTNFENKIQLTRDRNTMITAERILQNANTIITSFFNLDNQSLGNTININDLYNKLLAIDGVKAVKTKYLADGEPESSAIYFDGLSFAIWTQHLIEGADFTTITGNYKIKSFQFPVLLDSSSFVNKLEVTSDVYNISEVEY